MSILKLNRSADEINKTLLKVDEIPKIYLRKDALNKELAPIRTGIDELNTKLVALKEDTKTIGARVEECEKSLINVTSTIIPALNKSLASLQEGQVSLLQRVTKTEEQVIPEIKKKVAVLEGAVTEVQEKVKVTIVKS